MQPINAKKESAYGVGNALAFAKALKDGESALQKDEKGHDAHSKEVQ